MFFSKWYIERGVSLNRNILECKFGFCGKSVGAVEVLIETYWNVNTSGHLLPPAISCVLIETYWNVNQVNHINGNKTDNSLNRNILECKFGISLYGLIFLRVLIETYWNVNCTDWRNPQQRQTSLNRNILECK